MLIASFESSVGSNPPSPLELVAKHFVILFDVNLSGASSQSVKTGNINKITTLGRGDFGRETKRASLYIR